MAAAPFLLPPYLVELELELEVVEVALKLVLLRRQHARHRHLEHEAELRHVRVRVRVRVMVSGVKKAVEQARESVRVTKGPTSYALDATPRRV